MDELQSFGMEDGVHLYDCACPGCAAAADSCDASSEQTARGERYTVDHNHFDENQSLDGLHSGYKWATTDLTFSFPDSADDYGYGGVVEGFVESSALQAQVIKEQLELVEALSGLTFSLIEGAGDAEADIRFSQSTTPGTAFAYFPFSGEQGGDIWVNTSYYNAPKLGNYAWSTFFHEIGHALGLKHGHETGAAGALPYEFDSHEYSLMTYRSYIGSSGTAYTNGFWSGPQSLMMLDIATIQSLYGANFEAAAGDTVYRFDIETGQMFVDDIGTTMPGGNAVFRTIWDGDGQDTYDLSNYDTDLSIDLTPGSFVDFDVTGNDQRAYLGGGQYARGHVFNALQFEDDERSLIENAIGGSGDDQVIGNIAANALQGGAGDDTISGGEGNDTLSGQGGDDQLSGGAGADAFVLELDPEGKNSADLVTDLNFEDGDVLRFSGFLDAEIGSLAELVEGAGLGWFDVGEDETGYVHLSFAEGLWSASVELLTIAHDALSDAIAAYEASASEDPETDEETPDEETPEEEGDTPPADPDPSDEDAAETEPGGDTEEEPPVEEPPTEEPPTEEPPVEEPPTEEPPTEEPPVEEPPVEEPPTEEPPTEEPPFEDPPADDPPGEDPVTEEPGEDEPPVEDPPVEDPVTTEPVDPVDPPTDLDDEEQPEEEDPVSLPPVSEDDGDDEVEGDPEPLTPDQPEDDDDPIKLPPVTTDTGEDDTHLVEDDPVTIDEDPVTVEDELVTADPIDVDRDPEDIEPDEPELLGDDPVIVIDEQPDDVFIFEDPPVLTSGDDRWFGTSDTDLMMGGGGHDYLSSGSFSDTLDGGTGNDTLSGGDGNDFLTGGGGKDKIKGGAHADQIYGGGGADKVRGGDGRDQVYGGNGNDKVWGNRGRDDLYGENGNDRLIGGRGSDTMTGGAGEDTFVFGALSGKDVITDFEVGVDCLKIKDADRLRDLDITDFGNDVLIIHDHGQITLTGVDADDLSSGDFIF